MIILYEIVYFHLVFRFCVDLIGMVKIMQKVCKIDQIAETMKIHAGAMQPSCSMPQAMREKAASARGHAREVQCTSSQTSRLDLDVVD